MQIIQSDILSGIFYKHNFFFNAMCKLCIDINFTKQKGFYKDKFRKLCNPN